MGVLKLQTCLSSSIARRRILLSPAEPSPHELMGNYQGVYIGRTKTLNVPFYWDWRSLSNPHICAIGMTGSGKSFFIKTFITRAFSQWKTSALILDWSGEYSPWVSGSGGKIISLSKTGGFNLLDCSQAIPDGSKSAKCAGAAPKVHVSRLLNAISLISGISSPRALRFAKEALESAYKSKKIPLERPAKNGKKMPTLGDALKILKKKAKKSKDLHADEACLALEPFCAPYFSKGSLLLGNMLGRGIVSIDLSKLETDAHRSLAALVLMQFIKERMREEGQSEDAGLRQIIVVDEAWKIMQDERSDIVQILREGRKYSFSLITASQTPSDISPTIFSNSATLAVFRTLFSDFREQLSKSLNQGKSITMQMEKFSVGQALFRIALRHPGAYDGPFIISRIDGEVPSRNWFLEADKMNISIERGELKKRLWRLGCTSSQISQVALLFEKNDCSLKAAELARQLFAFGLSRSAILSLLRSINVPDGAILEIFSQMHARALGVSVQSLSDLVVYDERKN